MNLQVIFKEETIVNGELYGAPYWQLSFPQGTEDEDYEASEFFTFILEGTSVPLNLFYNKGDFRTSNCLEGKAHFTSICQTFSEMLHELYQKRHLSTEEEEYLYEEWLKDLLPIRQNNNIFYYTPIKHLLTARPRTTLTQRKPVASSPSPPPVPAKKFTPYPREGKVKQKPITSFFGDPYINLL